MTALTHAEVSALDQVDPFAAAIQLVDAGRVMESGPYWRRAIAAHPRDGQRWYAWGATLGQVGKYEEAEKALWGAIGLGYNASPVWEALGVVYVRLRKLVESEQAYREAVRRDAGNVAAWVALGNAAYAIGQRTRGQACMERAAALGARPGSPDVANAAQMRLWLGHWRLGWQAYEGRREMSEWRAAMKELPTLPGGPLAVRTGRWLRRLSEGRYGVLDARPVIVVSEQGQGDAVQFARFVPLVAERLQVPVWFRVHTALVPMMQGAFAGDARIRILDKGDTLGPEEVQGWVPLMSLPHFLGITNARELPPPIRPFGKQWVEGTGAYVHESGNPQHAYDWDRSVVPRGTLVAGVATTYGIVQYTEGDDWAATVEKLLGCARCVTVDTALAHVAMSLGVPTDLFPPTLPEWRWGHKRLRVSPWYPSAVLWHRERSDDWAGVIGQWTAAQ